MILKRKIVNPSEWHPFFPILPVSEMSVSQDGTVTITTYWLEAIQRRLISSNMTGVRRWDYRKDDNDTTNPENIANV